MTQYLATFQAAITEAMKSDAAFRSHWDANKELRINTVEQRDKPSTLPGSGNWSPLARVVDYCNSRNPDRLSAWVLLQLSGTGDSGKGDHEDSGQYGAEVIAAMMAAAHVAKRRGARVEGLDELLEVHTVYLGLFSVHLGDLRIGGAPSLPVLPGTRTRREMPGDDPWAQRTDDGPIIRERAHAAVCMRNELDKRPAPPSWGSKARWPGTIFQDANWITKHRKVINSHVSASTRETARPLIDILNGLGARMRPTGGVCEMRWMRSKTGCTAYLTEWPFNGPVLPPWSVMHFTDADGIRLGHPFPAKWGGDDPGPVTAKLSADGRQIHIEALEAQRKVPGPVEQFESYCPAVIPDYTIIFDTSGLRMEPSLVDPPPPDPEPDPDPEPEPDPPPDRKPGFWWWLLRLFGLGGRR